MEKIEQALFGYSNGHRLLGSSIKLSTSSLRLMEILSDLSGNDTSENFDGYYTGCWLPDDNCYSLSKTWYATEMPRPGCAWTHTLFFDSEIYSNSIKIPIDSLFKRPNIITNDLLNHYKAPIKIDLDDGNNHANSCYALWLFQTIISNKQNIAICYDNALDFNLSFALLFQLMGVAFFKNFSFCTGSQTNRMIKGKSLNLQVMPAKISKVALRSLSTVVPFEKITDNLLPFYITNINDLLEVKHFAAQIDENYYSFESFQYIQEIYYALYKANRIDLQKLISINKNAFTFDQAIKTFTSVLDVFIRDSITNIRESSIVLDLFFSISTAEEKYDNFINSLNVNNFNKYIFELYKIDRSSVLQLISKLLFSKLNNFGEELLKELAFTINSDDFVQLISEKQTYCIVLLQSNWKLAKNRILWKMPLGIQLDLIKNIAVAFNQSTYEEQTSFEELLFLIFENSIEEIFDKVYAAFKDFSITTYFYWIESKNNFNKNNWIRICKNNPSQSLLLLQSVSDTNFELIYSILEIIDPWDKSIRVVETKIWEKLYDKYYKGKNNNRFNDMFAKFMLQVMLNTNVKISDTFAYFVFMRVHKILESSDFDDAFWNKINSFLPELKWYNSWDKCKRLRKYAKIIGYNNIF